MSNSPKLSRRDWFRLRLPHQEQLDTEQMVDRPHALGQAESTSQPSGLKAIEHPPNHDGMNLEDLPPLREAMLSDADVDALLSDIQRHGSDIQLMQKRGARNSRASVDATSSLETAKQIFMNGTVNRLQVRYRWQNSLWIDTLARQTEGTRLVRVSHQTQ